MNILLFFIILKALKKHPSYEIKGFSVLNCRIIVAKLAVCATREIDFLVAAMGVVPEKSAMSTCVCGYEMKISQIKISLSALLL